MYTPYATDVKNAYTHDEWCPVITVGKTYRLDGQTVKVCRLWCVPDGSAPHYHAELENGKLVSIYKLSE